MMIGNACYFSGSDYFSINPCPSDEEIDAASERLREETHAKELEKSRLLPKAVYVNPALAEARRRGIVISRIRPLLSYQIEAAKLRFTRLYGLVYGGARFAWFELLRKLRFWWRFRVWP